MSNFPRRQIIPNQISSEFANPARTGPFWSAYDKSIVPTSHNQAYQNNQLASKFYFVCWPKGKVFTKDEIDVNIFHNFVFHIR